MTKKKQPAPQGNPPIEQKLKDTEQKLSQMTELGKRAVADMENMRRRMEEDRDRMALFANAELIKGLLPIVDNFRRAKKHYEKTREKEGDPVTIPSSISGYLQGIDLITDNLNRVLEKEGVKKIEALNKPFDPTFHEAVTMAKGSKDTVIEVLEDGYTLSTHVLRPAKVKIGTGE